MDDVSATRELRYWEGQRGAGHGAGTKTQGGIQHRDGVAYRVFKFLNPTTRREMMNWEDRDRAKGSRRGETNGGNDVTGEEEKKVKFESDRAHEEKRGKGEEKELVDRKWRWRDNRKGMYVSYDIHSTNHAKYVFSFINLYTPSR